MDPVTLKTSAVYISQGERLEIYRSLDDVPADLRERLIRTANSSNSATILIADRGGREEISRAMKGLPSRLQSRRLAAQAPKQAEETAQPSPRSRLLNRVRVPRQVRANGWIWGTLLGAVAAATTVAAWLTFR
jgi:hypothetical protein